MSWQFRAPKTTALTSLVCCMIHLTASAEKIPLADLPKYAMEQSQITVTGAPPFHLLARVVEATNRKNDSYNAEIEEYWVSPDKWRRTVKTADFTQTLIVNGQKTTEQLTGDYYPNWLRTLVSAMFIPDAALEGVDMSKSSDNPRIGGDKTCRRFAYRAGIPPVGNNVFSTFCFDGGLLNSIGKPGYTVEYQDYKKFMGKQVARKIREYIESGTELEASIGELSDLHNPDQGLFAVQQPTTPMQILQVSEATLRGLAANAPAIKWPAIHGGKTSGVLSIYVCIDSDGKVREIYALNSDHPDMSDAARQQVMGWQLKTPVDKNGAHVQIEGVLTFVYETKIAP